MNHPTNHHYLPEFHLKRWADEQGRIFRFTKPHDALVTRHVFPSQLGFERNLYTVIDPSSNEPFELETKFFQNVDSQAATAVRKITEKSALGEDELRSWAIYVRSLMHRTPDDLVRFRNAALAQLKTTTRMLAENASIQPALAARTEFDDELIILKTLRRIILNENILSLLVKCHWVAIDLTQANHTLMISDHPVIQTNGLLVEGGHIAMPISPCLLCLGAPNKATVDLIASQSVNWLAKQTNFQVVGGARHFVAATDASQTEFIRKHFSRGKRHSLLDT